MAEFRQTFIFTQVVGNTFADINGQIWGWSESWYSQTSDIASAQAILSALAPKRQKMLGANSILTFARSQLVGSPRQTQLTRLNLNGFSSNGNSDIPNTAVLMRMNTNAGVQRSYLFRGVPDAYIDQGGGYFPVAPYPSRVNDYFTSLTAGFNGVLLQTYGASQVVQSVGQVAGSPQVAVGVTDGTAFTVGGFCNIKGPRAAGAPQVRGKHKIANIVGNVVYINVNFILNPLYDDVAKALKIFPVTITYSNFAGAELRYSTHRITGRPLYLPRGRKPKRV